MAQHDYSLANQSGSAFRADLNNGLAAIVSNNSGASQPSTMYAYQWWADTTTGLLKQRNAANSAWITIGTLASANLGLATLASPTFTGTATIPTLTVSTSAGIPLGSASSPTLFFTGDANTGIYSPGVDQLAITTGGNQRLTVSSAGIVGVGTATAPRSNLDPNGDLAPAFQIEGTNGNNTSAMICRNSNNTAGVQLVLAKTRSATVGGVTAVLSGDECGVLVFQGADQTAFGRCASIAGLVDNNVFSTGIVPGALSFRTASVTSGTPSERMKIDSAGTTTLNSLASTAPFIAQINSAESLRVDSSGKLLVGTSSAITTFNATGTTAVSPFLQVAGTSEQSSSLGLFSFATSGGSDPFLTFSKSKSGTIGTHLTVASGDQIGGIGWAGSDGTAFAGATCINSYVDGTVASGSVPGRLVFQTTAVGASSPTEQLRLTNDGVLAYRQNAPTSKSAAATLTIDELKNGIIQYTGAAATLTLPTGTLAEGGFSGIYTNMTFEWSVINTGSGTCTIGAGTAHTIVGGATIAAGASGTWASRRTAANTFVSYRLS